MKIIMVKKIMADGSPCKKCSEVLERLETSGHIEKIDQVLIAREGEVGSEGALLADYYQVDKAPFFVVEEEGLEPRIYTIYFKLVKEVLNRQAA
ncbi:hypothetical protein [Endozoicomonas numazuensis]|uniref:Thioredoxin-like fold domain-containing protein n=1 Tax=Endozoicomonas numazuensis TaxID=1137799 RepID=A0A081NCE3_9GAMM|nr:hypothetical protein [Endozoicomonas numazuensis]KEQ16116.1 hypothetical protein GZ78_22885 [Endozoicomonas numazuensis]